MNETLRRYAQDAFARFFLTAAAAGLAFAGLLFGTFAIYRHLAPEVGDVRSAAILAVGLLAISGAAGAAALYRRTSMPAPPPAPAPETLETLLAGLIAGDAPAAPLARAALALVAGLLAGARVAKK
jgi:hypothetical protein